MATVRITGWKRGLNSIGAIKAVKAHSQLGLKAAKNCVESVMDGRTEAVDTPTHEEAQSLVAELLSFGVIAEAADSN